MSQHQLIQQWEKTQMKSHIPAFKVGDTVNVHVRIVEGGKERVQQFTGTVIARKGKGLSETFTIYRQAYGSNMERVFPLHSPCIVKIDVVRKGKVRRAKLYYLRGATGKASKVQEMIFKKEEKVPKEIPQPVAVSVDAAIETPNISSENSSTEE